MVLGWPIREGDNPVGEKFLALDFAPEYRGTRETLRDLPIPSFNPITTTTAVLHSNGLGMFPVRSPLLGESLFCFLFLEVLRWFTSLGLLSRTYEFSAESSSVNSMGLPHSDICGSKSARDSPQLFAACHVLLRL